MGELATNITSVYVWLGPEALCLCSSPPPVHTEPVERPRLLAHLYKTSRSQFWLFQGLSCQVWSCAHMHKHAKIQIFMFVSFAFSCLLCEEITPHADVNWFSPDKETSVEVYWICSPRNKFLTPSQVSSDLCCQHWHCSLCSIPHALSPCLRLYFSYSISSRCGCLVGKGRSGAVRGWSSFGLSRDRCVVRALIKRVTAPLQEIWPLELLSLTLWIPSQIALTFSIHWQFQHFTNYKMTSTMEKSYCYKWIQF